MIKGKCQLDEMIHLREGTIPPRDIICLWCGEKGSTDWRMAPWRPEASYIENHTCRRCGGTFTLRWKEGNPVEYGERDG